MRRNYRKRKYSYFIIFLIVLLSISTGYAALNSTLIIMGTSAIQKNTWDVHFENLNITEGSVTATTAPVITDSNRISKFTFVLDKRGDFYEFVVDVVNKGSLDAMVNSIEKTPTLTSEQEKYLTYTITYENNEEIKKNQLVKVNDFVRIKVRVEFKSDITASDLPQTQQVLNLGFHINYIQAEDTGVSVNNNGIKVKPVADGSLDNIGTIVTIGTEKFYTIGTEGDNVKLLSMYNLYVGNECTSGSSCTPYGEEATGKQDSKMVGRLSDSSYPRRGTTAFSSSTQKGTNYNDYNGSIVEGYVNNYNNYLIMQGVIPIESRLITKDELISLGCSKLLYSCSNAPSWVYATTYWSGSAYDTDTVWNVYSVGRFEFSFYDDDRELGVRPVIVIKKSDIEVQKIIPVADGSLDEIGTVVTIGSEQFYTIGTEGDNVKLLSMYNLYVGGEYNGSWTAYGDEATGLQDSTMIGHNGVLVRKGTIKFSNTKYWSNVSSSAYVYDNNSLLYNYIENYGNYLKNKDVKIEDARLINLTELESLGCSTSSYSCNSAPEWVTATSYWTGSNFSGDYLWSVYNSGSFDYALYSNNDCFGVRPVIIIPKSDIVVS